MREVVGGDDYGAVDRHMLLSAVARPEAEPQRPAEGLPRASVVARLFHAPPKLAGFLMISGAAQPVSATAESEQRLLEQLD